MAEHVRWLSQNWPGLISCQPNAGLPELVDGKTHYPLGAEELAAWMERFVEGGVFTEHPTDTPLPPDPDGSIREHCAAAHDVVATLAYRANLSVSIALRSLCDKLHTLINHAFCMSIHHMGHAGVPRAELDDFFSGAKLEPCKHVPDFGVGGLQNIGIESEPGSCRIGDALFSFLDLKSKKCIHLPRMVLCGRVGPLDRSKERK
jgi:hypothetical protein